MCLCACVQHSHMPDPLELELQEVLLPDVSARNQTWFSENRYCSSLLSHLFSPLFCIWVSSSHLLKIFELKAWLPVWHYCKIRKTKRGSIQCYQRSKATGQTCVTHKSLRPWVNIPSLPLKSLYPLFFALFKSSPKQYFLLKYC